MEDHEIPERELSDWSPITNEYFLAILGKAGEELCECSTAIFRCIIQGIDGKEPVTGKVNEQWLEDEIADVQAMLDHVVIRLRLDRDRIAKRKRTKYVWKSRWFESLRGVL
jgi:hypothetical protein